MDHIVSSYDRAGLHRAFKALPAPNQKYLKIIDAAVGGAPDSIGVVPLGPLKRGWNSWFGMNAVQAACWLWIHPDHLDKDHRWLPTLQKWVGLSKLSFNEFRRLVVHECHQLALHQRALSRHITARIAEAEFEEGLHSGQAATKFAPYQEELMNLSAMTAGGILREATAHAVAQLGDLLGVAATIVADSLAPNRKTTADFDANLMVQLNPDRVPPGLQETLPAGAAASLWEKHGEGTDRLVVVAETRQQSYLGFWLPLGGFEGGEILPGAPRAFVTHTPQAIFVDDLPTLPVSDAALRARWIDYLTGGGRQGFRGRAFVSFPVVDWVAKDQPMTAAILNVNFRSSDGWSRAYSRSWLAETSVNLTQWTSTLLNVLRIAAFAGDRLQDPRWRGLQLPFAQRHVLPAVVDARLALERKLRELGAGTGSGPLLLTDGSGPPQ